MWFWNRCEIYCGNSMKIFSELRDVLSINALRYDYKIKYNGSRRYGTFGENPDYSYQYYLYVHKKDYDQADYMINHKNT